MKLMRLISLVLLCIAFLSSMVLGQTVDIDALRKKAQGGDAASQFLLGIAYTNGEGVSEDKVEALKWHSKAAVQGFARSQFILGVAYFNGDVYHEDKAEGIKWYRKAALQGHREAQYALSVSYLNGIVVQEDKSKGFTWLLKSAEQGLDRAQFAVASHYSNGVGVPKDKVKSTKWYLRAANQGNSDAQAIIGISFYLGKGFPENRLLAYKWLNLAAVQGEKDVQKLKEKVAEELTAYELAEAQKLSSKFKPKKEMPNYLGGIRVSQELLNSDPVSFGTGFYVTSNGYLLTNEHVVNGARKVFVYSGSQRLPAQVVKTDAANDLALLKVSGTFAALPVSSSRRVKLGQTVSTVGFPNPNLQGKSPKLTKGEISSLSGASDDPKYFQISVPLQPGNSGGPLVDAYGNVVGVVTAKLSAGAALATTGNLPENVNYAVKGTFVMGFLESVPEVAAEMLDPKPRRSREFTEVVSEAEKASVMILVYE